MCFPKSICFARHSTIDGASTRSTGEANLSKRKASSSLNNSDTQQHQEEEKNGGATTLPTKKQKVQGDTACVSDESALQQSGSACLSEQDLRELSRKQLQKLAKQHGVKANMSTADLIQALQKSE